jgi:hypothetical protein
MDQLSCKPFQADKLRFILNECMPKDNRERLKANVAVQTFRSGLWPSCDVFFDRFRYLSL